MEEGFGLLIPPRLVGDSTQGEACLDDRSILNGKRGGHRHEGKGVRRALADLEVRMVRGKAFGRKVDGRDQLAPSQRRVDVGSIAGQSMKFGEGNRSFTGRSADAYDGLERSQGH